MPASHRMQAIWQLAWIVASFTAITCPGCQSSSQSAGQQAAAAPIEIVARLDGPAGDEIEKYVVMKEFQLASLEGVAGVSSLSRSGECRIRIEPASGVARDTLRKQLASAVQPREGVHGGVSSQVPFSLLPEIDDSLLVVAMHSTELSREALAALARQELASRWQTMPSVAAVQLPTAATPSVVVEVDTQRLSAHRRELADVVSIVKQQASESLRNMDDLLQVVLRGDVDRVVRLLDVATVRLVTDPSPDAILVSQGNVVAQAELVVVHPTPGQFAAVARQVDQLVAEAPARLPGNLQFHTLSLTRDDVELSLELPAGTEWQARLRLAERAAQALAQTSEVEMALVYVPVGDTADVRALIHGTGRREELLSRLCAALTPLEEARIRSRRPYRLDEFWPGEGADIAVRVSTVDHKSAAAVGEKLMERLQSISGVGDVASSAAAVPKLVHRAEPERLRELAILEPQVKWLIQAATTGIQLTNVAIDGRPVRIVAGNWNPEAGRAGLQERIEAAMLLSRQGATVPLREAVTIEQTPVPARVYRHRNRYTVVVSCAVRDRDVAAVRAEIAKLTSELSTRETIVQVE